MKFTKIFEKIDALNDLTTENRKILWLERIAFIFLTVMILFAPHSIAVTQSAWLIGMLASVIRLFFKPRQKFKLSAIDYALWTFFLWSVVSSALSYAPDISLDKLRGVSLFLIFYFVYYNLKTVRAAKFLAFALIFSSMFAVILTPLERIYGRGVEVHGVSAESPLLKAARIEGGMPIEEGNTIVQVGRKKIYSPEGLLGEIEKTETARLTVYHEDYYSTVEVKRADLLSGANASEKLGIRDWKRNHSWRAAGFYGHFTTFAEVLQLIISLAFGIFVGVISQNIFFKGETSTRENQKPKTENPDLKLQIFLAVCLAGLAFALLLTVTRASQFAFFVSAVVVVLLGGSRKLRLAFAVIIIPLAIIGLSYYQMTRKIGFDLQDASTQYRVMMWRDGERLFTENAHNFVFGVGMDSIKRYWLDWGLYDKGWQPQGHFHSTLVQLAVERGLPALIIWLTILGIYARTLWRGFKIQDSRFKIQDLGLKIEKGIILGCFGGMIGFFTSGLVHYNLGDGEVAMVFYILMGIGIFLCDSRFEIQDQDCKTNNLKS